jgi:hypothetical protein
MIAYDEALRRTWPILMEAARMRRTVSYSELAGRAGRPLTARAIHRQLLNVLSERCNAAGLPNLTALVVRKSTGLPGGGWFEPTPLDARDPATRWAEAVLSCYNHRWTKQPDARLYAPRSGP